LYGRIDSAPNGLITVMILKPERLEDAKMSVKKWHKHQPVNWEWEARSDIETKNDWSYII
jgi:hypothetical protein